MHRIEAAARGGALKRAISIGWRVHAVVALALIPPLVEIASFTHVERWLVRIGRDRIASAPEDEIAAEWVDRMLRPLPPPWRHTCLRRAAVIYYLLRANGRSVDLCIGVRRDATGVLLAHAWLMRDGVVYLEPKAAIENVPEYTMIARFPPMKAGTA